MKAKRWSFAIVLVLLAVALALVADPPQRLPLNAVTPDGSDDSGRALAAEGADVTLLRVDPQNSSALYRVQEQFVNIRVPSDAVGTTDRVSGSVAIDADGAVIQDRSSVRVNLDGLTSDQSRRDAFIKRNTLDTQRYPEAQFVPTTIQGLPAPLPHEGEADITIVGLLTIRDVTREVEWRGKAHFTPDGMRVTAQTQIAFEQFGIEKPRVALVLSVSDEIRLEVDMLFVRES